MKQISFFSLITLLSISFAYAAINITDFDINSIKSNLPEGVSVPPELENLPIPSVENATQLFKEKCVKESGSDAAYEQASQATTNLIDCAQRLVNFTALPKEIEDAKPNGNLDTVFNKYCDKRKDAIECVETFTNSLDPCLTQEERDQKVVIVNITKSLLEFICHENGNQIALFIAEEGPECFTAKQDELQDCFQETMGKYTDGELPTLENLPTLIIKEENCRDMDALEKCVVANLETCKESTPANLVEALFRFVRKETPCGKFKKNLNRPKRSLLQDISVTMSPELQDLTPNLSEVKKILKEKCFNQSKSHTAYREAEQAEANVKECAQEIVNIDVLKKEIDAEMKPGGKMDEIFKKYCDRRSEAFVCVETYLKSFDPCMTPEERDQKEITLRITKNLLEFLCHKDGSQIALFYAEEGDVCFESHSDEIQTCFNSTIENYTGGGLPSLQNFPLLVPNEKNCHNLNKLENCIVGHLQKCEDVTPANLVGSVFKVIRTETICDEFKEKNGCNGIRYSAIALIGTWFLLFLTKFLIH